MNIPVESIEIDYPIRILRYELVPDSGGSGKHRGGLGIWREYELLADGASFNVRGDRAAFAPRGLYGGGDGSFSTFTVDEGGAARKIPSKFSGRMKGGARLSIRTPGGGGFGAPAERDLEALKRDFVDGKISAAKIEADYGAEIMRAVSA